MRAPHVLVLALLGACTPATTSPTPRVAPIGPPASSEPSAPPNAGACKKAQETTKAAAVCMEFPDVLSVCDPSGWITTLEETTDTNAGRPEPDATMPCLLKWSLSFATPAGVRARSEFTASMRFGMDKVPSHFEIADVDGDGVKDAIVALTSVGPYGEDPSMVYVVYRVGEKGIEAWKPPRGIAISRVDDVDKDGKIDLEYEMFPLENMGQHGQPISSEHALTFVAHNKGGGAFAFDDDVARARAKQQCPSRPAPPNGAVPEPLVKWLPCAKLWGIPDAEITTVMDARCRSYDGIVRERSLEGPPGACPRFLVKWMSEKTPFTLR
jgi:hypothetical protein